MSLVTYQLPFLMRASYACHKNLEYYMLLTLFYKKNCEKVAIFVYYPANATNRYFDFCHTAFLLN